MKPLLLAATMACVFGCQKPKPPEQIADEVVKQLTKRVRPLDTSKNPPALPFPKNPPQQPNLAKVKQLSAEITSLKIKDLVVGAGPAVKPGSSITVHYVGKLPDGYIFDTSYKDKGTPFTFKYDNYDPAKPTVIRGWIEGLRGMRVGGRRELTIPASLAYGASPPLGAPIPPNAALLFDIQLLFVYGGA